MPFYVYDGDQYIICSTLLRAKLKMEQAISSARKIARFDREWPDWTEQIRAYEAPEETEEPYDYPCVLMAVETNIRRPSSKLNENGYDDDGNWWLDPDEYNCDYEVVECKNCNYEVMECKNDK